MATSTTRWVSSDGRHFCSALHSFTKCSLFGSASHNRLRLCNRERRDISLYGWHGDRGRGRISIRFLGGHSRLGNIESRRMLATSDGMAAREAMEKQFEEFRQQLDESGAVRERLRSIVSDLDSGTRLMHANLLLVHHSLTAPEVLEKAKIHIGSLRDLFGQLAEVIKGSPGQYYRYHDHWRNQTFTVVFLLVFLHWLETGGLLTHAETQDLLGLNPEEFGIDIEDYLIGLCHMSNELPRYVVNQVTAGDYECPRRVSTFLSDLYAAFRILNLRNDLLRKKFDGMKYDLKKVEEVLYDVKIRGLLDPPKVLSTAQTDRDTS